MNIILQSSSFKTSIHSIHSKLNTNFYLLPFSVGNAYEGIILENLLKASKEEDGRHTLFSVSSIYRPGMVQKKLEPYAKTTIDGIGCAHINGTTQLIGIEVKTRVTHGRRQEEVIRRQSRDTDNGMVFSTINPNM